MLAGEKTRGWMVRGMVAATLVVVALGSHAYGQVFQLAAPVWDVELNESNQGFLISTQPNEFQETLDEYRRYAKREQWEKSFEQLNKLAETKHKGLAPTKQGLMLPANRMIQMAIAELPPAGRKAYQLFYDAEAQKLLGEAQGKKEAENLSAVVSRFLLTSAGDEAADRLGDLYFEEGRLTQAVEAWKTILEMRPDSKISPAQLWVKIAVALASDDRWSDFEDVRKQVRERYANETVRIGQKEIKAVEALDLWSEKRPKDDSAADQTARFSPERARISIDHDAKPLWQFRWFPTTSADGTVPPALMMQDPWGRQIAMDCTALTVVDDQRLYGSLMGYDIAIDLQTGKLLWRSGKFFDMMQQQQQQRNRGYMFAVDQFGIAHTSDRLWCVTCPPKNNDNRLYLIARDIATGKEVFNSRSARSMRSWSLLGSPVFDGERAYAAVAPTNERQTVNVVCFSPKDGAKIWETKIGSYKVDPTQSYYYTGRATCPMVTVAGGNVYVDTHAGSMVQLDAVSGQIRWGLNYETEVQQTGYYYNQPQEIYLASPPVVAEGIVYVKGMRSRYLYAVDPAGPKVLWRRPVSKKTMFCGVDAERFYVAGEEIIAYDRSPPYELKGSQQIPLTSSWTRPLVTADRIYQYTSRGIFVIDKATMKQVQIFRGAERESKGGYVLLTPKSLITVSNQAITAYPIKPTEKPAGKSTEQARN